MTDPYIAALLLERIGYRNRKLDARAALVTAELERLGHVEDDARETTMLESAPETATPPRPRPRRSTHE